MKRRLTRLRWSLTLGLLALVVLGLSRLWPGRPSGVGHPLQQTALATSPADLPATLSPPERLRIRAAEVRGEGASLLELAAASWAQAKPTRILLNRTPRLYQTEPVPDRPVPGLEVRALRAGDKLYLRLLWDDTTKNAPAAPPRKTGTGGMEEQLYKRPTGETATFADAAAVMVPEQWLGPTFPALLMGDKSHPVRLFYWNASHGVEEMTASGRATPKPLGRIVAHRAHHADGKWVLTLELPDQPAGCPLAFAVWDGEAGDRDGLKCFSIWYVLQRE